jgi:hypothetical protein
MKRSLFCAIAATPILLFLVLSRSHAGGEQGGAWKPFLPADAYKELTKRSIANIETTATSGAKDAAEKIEAEAAIIVAYTLSVKNRDDAAFSKLRGAALLAVQKARNGELKKLADFGKSIASAPNAAAEKITRKEYLQELPWAMEIFKGKSKGGDGLHMDLQYHPKLKNLNGIEALIGALSGKKLSEENVAKVEKELPLLAYRIAVVGAITREFAPEKRAEQWRDLSMQMRDASIALAEASQKKNPGGILKAATTLESSCTQCHSAFKGK